MRPFITKDFTKLDFLPSGDWSITTHTSGLIVMKAKKSSKIRFKPQGFNRSELVIKRGNRVILTGESLVVEY